MKEVVFIKFGGSLITYKDKPRTVKFNLIKKLTDQFKNIYKSSKNYSFILGNGAGSFGHYEAVKHNIQIGKDNRKKMFGFSEVQNSVKELNKIFVDELLKKKIPTISVHQSSMIISSEGKLKKIFLDAVFGFLNLDMIPFVYGDIVYDEKRGSHIFSTEDAFYFLIKGLLEKKYQIVKVIYLTTVPGVFDKQKKVIKKIKTTSYLEVKKNIYKTEGFDTTGGMGHKLDQAIALSKLGIKTYIGSGFNENIIKEAVSGKNFSGTIIE